LSRLLAPRLERCTRVTLGNDTPGKVRNRKDREACERPSRFSIMVQRNDSLDQFKHRSELLIMKKDLYVKVDCLLNEALHEDTNCKSVHRVGSEDCSCCEV
jgi:hypothetical protein